MALPNTNISVAMVKAELRAATNDVGRLCIHPNINKWSKWKPVRHNKVTPLTEEDLISVNFGLQLSSYDTISDVIEAYQDGLGFTAWTYARPRGGNNNPSEPYRLDDFRNYKHDALPVTGGYYITGTGSKSGSGIVTGMIAVNPSTDTLIGWEDLQLGGRRLVMVLTNLFGDIIKTAVADSSEDTFVNMDINYVPVGFYTGWLLLSNTAGGITDVAGLEASPMNGCPVRIVETQASIDIFAEFSSVNPNQVTIEITCNNSSGVAASLTLCSLMVRNWINPIESPIEINEVVRNLGTIVAPIGSNVIYSETITIQRDYYPSWKVCWLNSGTYANTVESPILQHPVDPD